tara:strand:+ start:171 stop:2435 length:2265 start_codon:yes stop_codon:yes gene_type:complete
VHAWKACMGETPSRVQIPPSPRLIKQITLNRYLILILLFTLSLWSKETAPAYIQNFSGDVFIQSSTNQSSKKIPAIIGRKIQDGDIIKVLENSSCEIKTDNHKTLIRMDDKTELKFFNKSNIQEIHLKNGSLYIRNITMKNKNKTYLFSNHSQIYLTDSEFWISINDSAIDKIYSFGDEIFISDKYSGKKLLLGNDFFKSFPSINKEDVNMIHVTSNDIYSIDSSDPSQNFEKEIPQYIFSDFVASNTNSEILNPFLFRKTANDSLLFKRSESDLIPLYYSNTNVDIEESNYGLNFYAGGSYLHDNYYNNIILEPYIALDNFELVLKFDEYIRTNDSSQYINIWMQGGGNPIYLNPATILSKISYMSWFNDDKTRYINVGKLKNLSFGHGMLLHKYSNSYNYPIMQRTGVQIHLSPKNRYSYNFDFIISDISQTFNEGGLFGGHASLFLSKFFPLTVGMGYIYDFDQHSEISADLEGSSSLEARQLDLDYSLVNNKNYKLNLIYEWDGIFYPDTVHYIRNTETNPYEPVNTTGTQGHTIGGKVSLDSGHKVMLAVHANQALYTPYYFSSTYDFEKVRTLEFNDQNYAHDRNKEYLDNFCIGGDCQNGDAIYLSKELYPVMSNGDFVFPTLGGSIQYDYNYYNKRGISFSGMYLIDNHPDSNNSYYLLDFEIFSKGGYLFKRLDNYKFYFHRNFTNTNQLDSNNENIMFGTTLDIRIVKSFKLYLDFQNVFYDIDEDTIVDHVKVLNAQIKYEFK